MACAMRLSRGVRGEKGWGKLVKTKRINSRNNDELASLVIGAGQLRISNVCLLSGSEFLLLSTRGPANFWQISQNC